MSQPFALGTLLFGSNFAVGGTSPGNVGNTLTFGVTKTTDVFLISFTVVGIAPSGVVNFNSFAIDGGAWQSDAVRTHSPNDGSFFTSTRTAHLTGLTVGNHTLGVRSWNNVAGSTTINGVDSNLLIIRF